jgi:glycosyltransferase involved in cell wall biosynthesis
MMQVVFSIIIPCYNHAKYLEANLSSILAQDFKQWEAIIVNDGSTDDSLAVAQGFADRDTRIRILDQENQGLSAARNAGVMLSSGEWIVLLDADDTMGEGALQAIHTLYQEADIVIGSYNYIDENDINIYTVVIPETFLFSSILKGNAGPPASISFRKCFLDKTGMFDTTLTSAEDWDMWIRFYKCNARYAISRKVIANYRILDSSMSRNAFRMYENLVKVAQRAVVTDERLDAALPLNQDIADTNDDAVKRSLLMCLGVSIMQGKHDASVELFNRETKRYNLSYAVSDFGMMCSYLSFRYRYSKEDTQQVFRVFYPLFKKFFEHTEFLQQMQGACLQQVFQRHHKVRIRNLFGPFAPMVNRIYEICNAY